METALALLLTAVVGCALGALGSGGSILMLPVLVYVAGLSPARAVPVTLVVVGGTSLLGAWMRLRAGQFHWDAVKFLSLTGVVGALLGAQLTPLVDERVLMLVFAALMLAVGLRMAFGGREGPAAPACRPLLCLGIGAAIGVLTGFLGVGGGFLIVPALIYLAGIETTAAIGASLAIIAINAAAGLAGQLGAGAIAWRTALAFLTVAVAGMLAGTRLASRLPAHTLQRALALLVLAIGGVIGALNLHALLA